ncbi:DNA recombination protein RmuC [Candidatus Gracilibacteria bacterium]|nr:DNA recombination protein RmuC [Candidatus Gracilibacteria bacterium]
MANVFKKSTNGEVNSDEIINKVGAGLSQQQIQFQTETSKNLQELASKFTELQSKLEGKIELELNNIKFGQSQHLDKTGELFNDQNQKQIIHFEKLKGENLNSLQRISEVVSKQLSNSIQDILNHNKNNFEQLAKINNEKLTQIQGEIDKRLTENLRQNLKSFEDVTKNLGHMQSTAQKMIDSTKSVDKLNNIFERTNSKGFGNFAENYLETILSEHLNVRDWSKQVQVPDSQDKIDFMITVGGKKIGIDSKFPVTAYQDYLDGDYENKSKLKKAYLKQVLTMAKEISHKYSKPGFIDTLFLYLPSDSMYNEVVNDPEIMEAIHKTKVTPVSPTTIFPIILLVNAYEFKLKVNENAEMIIQGLQKVSKNVDSFREEFRKLGDKIRQAQTNYDVADKNLVGLQTNILKLESAEIKQEEQLLELE